MRSHGVRAYQVLSNLHDHAEGDWVNKLDIYINFQSFPQIIISLLFRLSLCLCLRAVPSSPRTYNREQVGFL